MAAVTLLEAKGLTRRYSGLLAVDDVEFSLEKGEIHAIIGPNGAGKTTLVGMISGRVSPTSGTINFRGEDVTSMSAPERVMAGIVYTFQVTSLFKPLTAAENVRLAVQRRQMTGFAGKLRAGDARVLERVDECLARVGLAGHADRVAAELPYGHQRLLEVAMGLALEPELLILDEPTQGLAPAEIVDFMALVRKVAETATVLIIEHNLKVVLELSERITVMDQGRVIAEGSPDEIERHPAVQRAYLGA